MADGAYHRVRNQLRSSPDLNLPNTTKCWFRPTKRDDVAWRNGRKAEMEVRRRSSRKPPEVDRRALAQAEWQLSQIQQIGGAALTEGLFTNPMVRAVLIPLGGTGIFQAMDFLSGSF
jgi:hypothetical protein